MNKGRGRAICGGVPETSGENCGDSEGKQ